MFYAFAICPQAAPHNARIFLHPTASKIADIETDELEAVVKTQFGVDWALEDMEFFEIGEYRPINFEKHVSFTIYQG